MNARHHIRTGHSCAAEPQIAVREFHAQVAQADMELVVFFCSSEYDLDALAAQMNRQFPGTRVVGCTTAGEIGPSGYRRHSLSGASFPGGVCQAAIGFIEDLKDFTLPRGQAMVRALLHQMSGRSPDFGADNSFAFLLIDGLSIREEVVTRAIQNGLGAIPLVGGSAGDDLKFTRTHVFHDGAFHTDSAVLMLISTSYPFRVFKTQHFTRYAERLVVTDADPTHRIVREINGRPAAEEYARAIGVAVDDLTPACFAALPMVVVIEGTDYVRSIQKANPDGSLTFYCAIDTGLVFHVARSNNLVTDLEQTFLDLRGTIGPPQVVLACNCILRDLEPAQRGQREAIGDIFRNNHAVGFSTYGEQYAGMHVNQTLTGIAIGDGDESIDPGTAAGGYAERSQSAAAVLACPAPHAPEGVAGNPDLAGKPALREEILRLNKIVDALMNRVEQSMGAQGSDFGLFQTAIQLESQVRTRTRELEEARLENERINIDLQRANRELEAFSYSVAHDLRAPLRGIDGFSRILMRTCADRLDDECRENLRLIREGAQRMGELIDALIHLSRCSRSDLHRQPVDLAALARTVAAGLRQADPERRVDFILPDTLPADGDPRLLTVLLENLLSNAWKYTRQRKVARVELGYDPGLSAFYVRDNGAGFNMAYVGKLFRAFQRLHSPSEFEGTGIGLAIVQRIVERHGGRAWAQAKPGEGATFYFTLPAQPVSGA